MFRSICILAVSLLFSVPAWAACQQKKAEAMTEKISKDVNTLADMTTTACVPAANGSRCDIICISTLRIPSDTSRELWMIVVAGLAGKYAREGSLDNYGDLHVADKGMLESRKRNVISLAKASEIQRAAQSNKINFEQLRSQMGGAYKMQAIK